MPLTVQRAQAWCMPPFDSKQQVATVTFIWSQTQKNCCTGRRRTTTRQRNRQQAGQFQWNQHLLPESRD